MARRCPSSSRNLVFAIAVSALVHASLLWIPVVPPGSIHPPAERPKKQDGVTITSIHSSELRTERAPATVMNSPSSAPAHIPAADTEKPALFSTTGADLPASVRTAPDQPPDQDSEEPRRGQGAPAHAGEPEGLPGDEDPADQAAAAGIHTETPPAVVTFSAVSPGGYFPKPEYPMAARRWKFEGVVIIRMDVDADGTVKNAAIVQSSGHGVLDDSALKTVRTMWRFRPAGYPFITTRELEFRITN